MINKINHYALNPQCSQYDEEALTALELAARTAAKVNETVEAFNAHENKTNTAIEVHNQVTAQRLTEQDARIERMNNIEMPAKVSEEVGEYVADGRFDEQVGKHLDNLNERVNNLLGSVEEGSTTLDAEVIDLRLDVDGNVNQNAGLAVRGNFMAINARLNENDAAVAFEYGTNVAGNITTTYIKTNKFTVDTPMNVYAAKGYQVRVAWFAEDLTQMYDSGYGQVQFIPAGVSCMVRVQRENGDKMSTTESVAVYFVKAGENLIGNLSNIRYTRRDENFIEQITPYQLRGDLVCPPGGNVVITPAPGYMVMAIEVNDGVKAGKETGWVDTPISVQSCELAIKREDGTFITLDEANKAVSFTRHEIANADRRKELAALYDGLTYDKWGAGAVLGVKFQPEKVFDILATHENLVFKTQLYQDATLLYDSGWTSHHTLPTTASNYIDTGYVQLYFKWSDGGMITVSDLAKYIKFSTPFENMMYNPTFNDQQMLVYILSTMRHGVIDGDAFQYKHGYTRFISKPFKVTRDLHIKVDLQSGIELCVHEVNEDATKIRSQGMWHHEQTIPARDHWYVLYMRGVSDDNFRYIHELENIKLADGVCHDTTVKSIAHRGYSHIAPENTLAAIRAAKAHGFSGVELDVRMTVDDVPVLMHLPELINYDPFMETSPIPGVETVDQATLEQIKTIDVGKLFVGFYMGEQIPTLEEALTLCKQLGIDAYLHLKAWTDVGYIGDYIVKTSMKDHAYIMTEYGYYNDELLEGFESGGVANGHHVALCNSLSQARNVPEKLPNAKTLTFGFDYDDASAGKATNNHYDGDYPILFYTVNTIEDFQYLPIQAGLVVSDYYKASEMHQKWGEYLD